MLIDGEKWACEACVRGHRVSNCQHSDRPLQHINKKGRPVSQCPHCRSLRKSRSSHVKCDCGEKTHKCMHLKAAADGHKDSCCCKHGGRCTCSHKKDHPLLDPVFESDESDHEPALPCHTTSGSSSSLHSRRRANTVQTDAALSFDENGHHKPTYKHAKAHETCGPYQLSRMHSFHDTNSLTHRSVDDLLHFAGTVSSDNSAGVSPASSGAASFDQRQTRSETASPRLAGASSAPQLSGSIVPPLDLAIDCSSYIPSPYDFFGNLSDNDQQPLFSAGLSAGGSVDWSNFEGLEFATSRAAADDFAPSNYSQPQSLGTGVEAFGSDQLPTMTTTTTTTTTTSSNSGDVSEADDLLAASSSASEPLDFEGPFRSNVASSAATFDLAQAQADLVAAAAVNLADEGAMGQFNKYLPTPAASDDSSALLAVSAAANVTLSSATATPFSLSDDESAFWMMPDASGLSSVWEASS